MRITDDTIIDNAGKGSLSHTRVFLCLSWMVPHYACDKNMETGVLYKRHQDASQNLQGVVCIQRGIYIQPLVGF